MKPLLALLAVLALGWPAHAQLFTLSKEQVLHYTALNPFGRFDDGRPMVPDSLLEKVQGLSAEEVFSVLEASGYHNQYEGGWKILHPGKKLVGRAVTAQYMPGRPDVTDVVNKDALAKGMPPSLPERVIDQLRPGTWSWWTCSGKWRTGPSAAITCTRPSGQPPRPVS